MRSLLAPAVFSRLVLVERRRAERSGGPFGILVLRAAAFPDPSAPALERAVAAVTRATDVAGWIDPGSTLGVLLPDLAGPATWATVERVRARVERALLRHPAAGPVSVTGRLFPEPAGAEAAPPSASAPSGVDGERIAVESLLYPELGISGRARRQADALKRAVDIAGSLALLAALAPVALLIAGLVRATSRGPALFRQVRVGYRGRPFTMLKFRTMREDADPAVHVDFVSRLIADGRSAVAANGSGLYKLTDDPRVTPLGRLLRKTSLDEVPQLWNVLRGEMSLVGPRPPLPYELERYAPWHRRRVLDARPGLTGLWQVRGRSRTTFDEMVRLDLRYARTRSFWTDLRILLATPRAVISGKDAC